MIYCLKCNTSNQKGVNFCTQCGQDLTNAPQDMYEGKEVILSQRYRMITPLKIGGMAGIYLAKDTRLNSICAIKELHIKNFPDIGKENTIQNFKAEAELLANLRHTSLPRVIDYFYENSKYYLVMDYISGDDLASIMEKDGIPWLPEDKILSWAIDLCDVLIYLHNQNPPVIYRDLKPSNIMLRDSDQKVILIDFGLAQMVHIRPAGVEMAFGTAGYAPPEQYSGREEPRSDIYSLGATLHHLLTGIPPAIPFKFKPVRETNNISPEFEAIVMKALEKNINFRYSSALLMKEALVEFHGKLDIIKNDKIVNERKSLIRQKFVHPVNMADQKKSPSEKIRVFLAEDDISIRKMLNIYMRFSEDLIMVGEAANGQEAIEKFKQFERAPDIILMDISMPEVDGIEATREIIKIDPSAKIMILTAVQSRREIVLEAFKAGAIGYMIKDTAMDNIADAIIKAHQGGSPIEPTVASILINEFTGQSLPAKEEKKGKSENRGEEKLENMISPEDIFKFDLSSKIQSINFGYEERSVLPYLDGNKTVLEISLEIDKDYTDVANIIYKIYSTGLLKKIASP